MIRRLAPAGVRSTPLLGFAPAGIIALALAWTASRQPTGTTARLLPTRLAILALAIATAFVFDDPAARLTDPVPSPLRVRRLIRTMTASVPAAVLVWLVLLVASTDMDLVRVIASEDSNLVQVEEAPQMPISEPVPSPFPGGRIALEAATLIVFTLATAAAVSRRGENEPGRITTSVLLGVYAITWMIPDSFKPWADPSNSRWETGAPWWWVGLGGFVVIGVTLSWDVRKRAWTRHRGMKRTLHPSPSRFTTHNVSDEGSRN
jgi:hypothetical protein